MIWLVCGDCGGTGERQVVVALLLAVVAASMPNGDVVRQWAIAFGGIAEMFAASGGGGDDFDRDVPVEMRGCVLCGWSWGGC